MDILDIIKNADDDELAAKRIIFFINELIKNTLTDYTKYLVKNSYCDSDVYEEPTAIDRFLILDKQKENG